MYTYSIYGLTLRTNRPLPNVGTVDRDIAADVVVELAGVGDVSSMPATAPTDASGMATPFQRVVGPDGEYVRIMYEGAGHEAEFLLDAAGNRVWVRWNALVGLEDVTALLTGPMLVCVLRLRGLTCLHASVIDVDGAAIALLGAKGAGKTTTALALTQRGARLLSDDVAVLDASNAGYTVRAGHPRLRLRPEPAAALVGSFDALAPVWSRENARPPKRYLDLHNADGAALLPNVPLRGIYILGARGDGTAAALATLANMTALPMLMANRHMAAIADRAGHRRDFAMLAEVSRRVAVRMVDRAEGVSHVGAVAAAILADVAARH